MAKLQGQNGCLQSPARVRYPLGAVAIATSVDAKLGALPSKISKTCLGLLELLVCNPFWDSESLPGSVNSCLC